MPLSALGSLGTAACIHDSCAIEGWGGVVVAFGSQHTPFLLLKNMQQGLGGGLLPAFSLKIWVSLGHSMTGRVLHC